MAENSKIEWTDATWNHIVGCSVVSPGCTNCYAMRLAGTRMKDHPTRSGLTVDSKAGPVWNGQVRFLEHKLTEPLRWTRPRMIFVCAHGDLFHEGVPDEWIDKTFAVMALAPRHTFQVLTKRSGRMRAYMDKAAGRIADTVIAMRRELGIEKGNPIVPLPHVTPGRPWWPLPNVWLGVSTEDQKRADERIPDLLATPAAVRWISAEPLLGPVDLSLRNDRVQLPDGLHWVVAGGESGPGARPMHKGWARSLRDQCAAAGVAFHFKQWGDWLPCVTEVGDEGLICWPEDGRDLENDFSGMGKHPVCAAHGHEFWKVGKARAGRLLDGVEHNGMPEVRRG